MPNYEHFKKYDEWSKQKPAAPPEPAPKPTLLKRLKDSLRKSGPGR